MHQYTILEPFTAVEATAPPAEVHGRDATWVSCEALGRISSPPSCFLAQLMP
jgi:hypothetical protein